jgi:hypothetical protein
MYPKRFTFDPALIERARVVTLRSPNLNVLRNDNRAEMPGIAHFLEDGFKARDKQGKLLLPDLSALLNRTIGIFSDYGGEDASSRYFTYSFLVCAMVRWARSSSRWPRFAKHPASAKKKSLSKTFATAHHGASGYSLSDGRGLREIARALGCSRDTVREVRDGLRACILRANGVCYDPPWAFRDF